MFVYNVKLPEGENDLGIVAGTSYANALANISTYYGEDNVIAVRMSYLEDSAETVASLVSYQSLKDLFTDL